MSALYLSNVYNADESVLAVYSFSSEAKYSEVYIDIQVHRRGRLKKLERRIMFASRRECLES